MRTSLHFSTPYFPVLSPSQACSLSPIPSSSLYGAFIYRRSGDSFFCNYTYPFSFLIPFLDLWQCLLHLLTSLICKDKAAAGCTRLVKCCFQIFPIPVLSLMRKNLLLPFHLWNHLVALYIPSLSKDFPC